MDISAGEFISHGVLDKLARWLYQQIPLLKDAAYGAF
jgi:hypothetical protein